MASDSQFALAQKYQPYVDAVYKKASLTQILDVSADRLDFVGADTVKIFKTEMDGLSTYNRNNGFTTGAVSGSWETLTLSQDRGAKFNIDTMSNEETLDLALGTTVSEFLRVHEVTEVDAYRFAKMAQEAGNSYTIQNGDTADTLVDAALATLLDAEVDEANCVLFVNSDMYTGLKAAFDYKRLEDPSRGWTNIAFYNDMPVIRVPQSRFYTKITLNDIDHDNSLYGGYTKAADGYDLKFMIVDRSAVLPVIKHQITNIIAPEYNNDADGYIVKFRLYHDLFVPDNKSNGIYICRAAS